jgi:hypothetical protein
VVISKIQVESYFNRNTVSVDSKALKTYICYWCCNDCARRRDYKKENMSLNQPANRGAFVKNFETYIEYAKRRVVCKDLRMLRYQILEEIRLTILQTQCIFP